MYQFAAATLLVALALAGVCHGAAAAPRPDWRDFACRTCDLPEMAGELILAGVRNSTLLPCDDPQVAHLAVSFQASAAAGHGMPGTLCCVEQQASLHKPEVDLLTGPFHHHAPANLYGSTLASKTVAATTGSCWKPPALQQP